MKNSELYEIITKTHHVSGVTTHIQYYAKSKFNSWTGIAQESRNDAVNDGEEHAKILKTIYPQLNDPEDIKLKGTHMDQGDVR